MERKVELHIWMGLNCPTYVDLPAAAISSRCLRIPPDFYTDNDDTAPLPLPPLSIIK